MLLNNPEIMELCRVISSLMDEEKIPSKFSAYLKKYNVEFEKMKETGRENRFVIFEALETHFEECLSIAIDLYWADYDATNALEGYWEFYGEKGRDLSF